MADPRAATNALFSENRVKLGVFALNAGVNAMTKVPEKFEPTWPAIVEVVQAADRAGYETLVPYARWGSFGPDAQHYSARAFENLTWAAAVAAITRHCCVMSTIQVQTVHPILAAKAMTTIDHVSGGRFGLNLVVGNPVESAMFGAPEIPHHELYAYADEWLRVVKGLWTEDGIFDFTGKYLSLAGAMSTPKPIQRPAPPVMNAARSTGGQAFVARHCDLAFVRENDRASLKAQVETYRRQARELAGREIQIWCNVAVVQRASRAEAEAYVSHYADRHGDEAYLQRFIDILNPAIDQLPPPARAAARHSLKRGVGAQPLLGNARDIAQSIAALAEQGIDGILLNWIDPRDGITRFNAEVLPMLESMGLRLAARGQAL